MIIEFQDLVISFCFLLILFGSVLDLKAEFEKEKTRINN